MEDGKVSFVRWTQQQYDAYIRRGQVAFADRRKTPRPKPEPIVCDDALATAQGKESHAAGFRVRITSYRRRFLDPDNLQGGCKYFVDCCRYAKLIPGDRPQDIILEVRQEKVRSQVEQRTEIEIEKL